MKNNYRADIILLKCLKIDIQLHVYELILEFMPGTLQLQTIDLSVVTLDSIHICNRLWFCFIRKQT